MILWNDKTAAEATGGKAQGTWQASRVEIDSRRIQPGDLFVAIKGENFDGHQFVADALKKGAVAAVISKRMEGNHLLVSNTQKALEDLGRYARKRAKAKIVGVTGSVGKTSTKEMLKVALSAHGRTHASTGNFNNHIGTPLNLANLAPDIEFAVFEMGMNHAGEISHLTKMVEPHVAAITNIEGVHMEFFASIDDIADAKAEIFEGVAAGGTAIINKSGNCFERLEKAAKLRKLNVITCGNEGADCQLLGSEAKIAGKHIPLALNVTGKHLMFNSLIALAAVSALGLDPQKSAEKLKEFKEPEGRGRVMKITVEGKSIWLIDDSYNASPASMNAAFDKTQDVWKDKGGKGRKIAALGNMLELGPQSISLHKSLEAGLNRNHFDRVFTAGELMQNLYSTLQPPMPAAHAAKAMELLPLLSKELRTGDILLIKGSHGSKMYELAKALQDMTEGKQKHAV
jgi:UDP-N-acetylmuramoyl-tripeptide--D-alanyl-D-alanine ligase